MPLDNSASSGDSLAFLEAESIRILREVAAEFERPVLLFSGGKDSICLLRLAEKAFRPNGFPFPLLHIDTGHNFPETLEYRDRKARELGERLIVRSVEDAVDQGIASYSSGGDTSRNRQQIPTLLAALEEFSFDAAIGGARRDEEKSRAKERIFSHRNIFGQWDPKNQRPEPWGIVNPHIHPGEHMRIFPLSNWTELDVWDYIERESLALPSLYFAHRRNVYARGGQWIAQSPFEEPPGPLEEKWVRYRTIGDMVSTGAVASRATTVAEVIDEITRSKVSERGQRRDDKTSDFSLEERKKEGYF